MPVELGLGMAVGIIMALTGAGGGILAVPLLIFAADLPMSQAAPVALLAVGLSAAFGALLYTVVTGGEITEALTGIIDRALNTQ